MTKINFHRRHLIQFFILVVLIFSVVALYLNWHQIIRQVIGWQKDFHNLLSVHISNIKQDPLEHGLSLIGLSFGYGVFHAIGPGHGKAVIITYLSSHRESLKRGIIISFLAALFQAFVAVMLVVVLAKLFSIRLSDVNSYADSITSASYLLVMGLGAYLLVSACWQQWKKYRQSKQHTHGADDHSDCCGGHTHQAQSKESWLQSIMVIFSMGSRPCSGAIVVLIYAYLVGEFFYGVLATLMMGVGTGLSIAGIGLGTQLTRNWFESLVKEKHGHGHGYHHQYSHSKRIPVASLLRMIGGLIIFLLGYSLFQTTFITSNHPLM